MKQQEQVEWDEVNKRLQRHGFKPLFFADPVENKNLSELVLLDKRSAGDVRTTLKMMLTDSERRQALVQELVMSNNQLKEEAQQHMNQAAQQSQKVLELDGLLDRVKTKVQDLEDRFLCNTVQLQQDKKEAKKRCEFLELKLSKLEEEAARLQKKLHFTVKEEEQRLARQSQAFHNICNKVCQQNSAADQQVLDVIDFYEAKMSQLLDELRSAKGEKEGSEPRDPTRIKKTSSTVAPSFKTIFKAYQEQQKESSNQVEELKREVERLKKELETRPTIKEVKFYKHKLRRLEGLNKHDNMRPPKEDRTTEMDGSVSDQFREARRSVHYHHLLTEIHAVVTNPSAPLRLRGHGLSTDGLELEDLKAVLPTLEEWAQQLHLLKDLHERMKKLLRMLMPWQRYDEDAAQPVKVEEMLLLVDIMLENISADAQQKLRSPTRYTLGSMVSHFQTLFDAPSLSGVFPRMNEVYTRLGEMTNAMRNLRDALDLDSRVSPAEVVKQVARLVSSREHTAGVHKLLGDEDINSIITKVQQHDEFLPAFHALVTDILHVLGVSHLDDILPALKSLKQIR